VKNNTFKELGLHGRTILKWDSAGSGYGKYLTALET
jgi:hypothetical protein